MHVAPIACLHYVNIREIDRVLVLVVFVRTYLLTETVIYVEHSDSKQSKIYLTSLESLQGLSFNFKFIIMRFCELRINAFVDRGDFCLTIGLFILDCEV